MKQKRYPQEFKEAVVQRIMAGESQTIGKCSKRGGEIQLTDAIAAQLDAGCTWAYRFDGIRYDCGSKQGFWDATIRYACKLG